MLNTDFESFWNINDINYSTQLTKEFGNVSLGCKVRYKCYERGRIIELLFRNM